MCIYIYTYIGNTVTSVIMLITRSSFILVTTHYFGFHREQVRRKSTDNMFVVALTLFCTHSNQLCEWSAVHSTLLHTRTNCLM